MRDVARPSEIGTRADESGRGDDNPRAVRTALPAPKARPLVQSRPEGRKLSNREESNDPFRAGDPRADRHIGRGRYDIDGMIDLHGYDRKTARAALYRFINACVTRGDRCVLVITGKGDSGGAPIGVTAGGKGRGVIRAALPAWLKEEELRRHIARAAPARQHHGGAGAIYLFLKKRRG
ncbi:MAG: Smr/MutS family protein [Pseudomonadota bacterium]